MKKRFVILLAMLYLVYFIALVVQNDIIGDILSPTLTILALLPVLLGFYKKEKNKLLKISGLFLALFIFTWFLSDFMWGFSAMILHIDPGNILLITYGYSLANLFLVMSLMVSGYFQIRSWSRMQILLDTMMVVISTTVLIWVFVFEQKIERAAILLSDPVSMFSLVTDIMIYTWITIWFFSVRNRNISLAVKISATGGIVFVVTDIIYYYVYFYQTYEPNSLLDGGYIIAFALMGMGGWIKLKKSDEIKNSEVEQQTGLIRFRKELFFLAVPLLLLVFKGTQAPSLLFLVTSIMLYFIFTNYTQNSIHRDELLQKQKEHVIELEQRVEERTAEIVRIMSTDIITGLKNRRYLEEYLERKIQEIEIQEIESNEKIYLLYIDQNKYKSMKSIYGRYVIEKSLVEVGRRIEQIMDEKDGLVTSYGEDIFVAVFKSNGPYEEALSQAEKIVNFCGDNYLIENHVIGITINIGISCYPVDSKNIEELIRNADTAMLQARKTGFNVIQKYDHQIGAYINRRDRIELKLKKVVFDEAFSLQYQPQVLCTDGSIYGVEALLRWCTKSGNFIPPLDFIPLAEENGMIIPLGYWIIEQAARQLSKWRKELKTEIKMAVNVSSKQLLEVGFADRLREILVINQISPEDFEIEITENVQLENNTMIQETLNQISEMNISIAIDDFGTGYSSLHYIKQLPVDRIKIAKELIDHIETDIYSKSIVQMLISVAKVNQIKVIAEGVETKEQWDYLKKVECDEIQGFYFSKPLVPSVLEKKWLSKIINHEKEERR